MLCRSRHSSPIIPDNLPPPTPAIQGFSTKSPTRRVKYLADSTTQSYLAWDKRFILLFNKRYLRKSHRSDAQNQLRDLPNAVL